MGEPGSREGKGGQRRKQGSSITRSTSSTPSPNWRHTRDSVGYPETEADQKETKEAGVLPRLRRSFSAKRRLSLVLTPFFSVLRLRLRLRAPTLSPRSLARSRVLVIFPPQIRLLPIIFIFIDRFYTSVEREIFARQITSDRSEIRWSL